jgi:hypothetical protein
VIIFLYLRGKSEKNVKKDRACSLFPRRACVEGCSAAGASAFFFSSRRPLHGQY